MPPADVLAQIPKLYKTEKVATADKMVWVHYFGGPCDWYVVELDQEQDLIFGFCRAPEGEWGYSSLEEMEALNVHGGLIIVERDCFWTPKKFSEFSRSIGVPQ